MKTKIQKVKGKKKLIILIHLNIKYTTPQSHTSTEGEKVV